MPFFETTEGVGIHYETAGEGLPLVFIHGWAMSGSVWRFQQRLAESYRLIIPDLRGHGLSSAPDSGYSFESFARDLEELFLYLGLEKAVIIAWSMGVQAVLQAFPRIRKQLAALVFVSGTPKFTAAEDYPYGLPTFEARGLGIRLKKDYEKAVRDFIRRMFTEEECASGCYERMIEEKIGGALPARHAAQASLTSLAEADFRSVLPTVDVPVLLVHGSDDTICPSMASRDMAGRLPCARLEIIKGAGHAPFISRPTEFTNILDNFIHGIHEDD
jgi:pimeloyl-[acyl-carrier protein] methyl ester esterase